MATTDARRLHLLLAAVEGAVPVEALASSGLWGAADLWLLCEDARQAGLITTAKRGLVGWAAAAQRGDAVAAGTPDDFAALLAVPAFAALLLDGARAAAAARDFRRAEPIYRAVAATGDRAGFPGGAAGWMAAVIEGVRIFRAGWPDAQVLAAALEIARARGDLAAQAVLLAARGLLSLLHEPAEAEAILAEAVEAAEATGSAALRAEVRTYIAVALVLEGRLREGIAAFEALLGDVGADPLAAEGGRGPALDLEGAAAGGAIGLLAFAYAGAGELPRALDLLERVRSRGRELGSPTLEARGRLFLALAHMMAGDPEAARPHAEAGQAAAGLDPVSAWYPAVALAYVRAADGRRDEARAILERAGAICPLARRPWAGGSQTLALLSQLGLDVDAEIARHLDTPRPFFAGVAQRFRAQRILAQGGDEGAAAAHLSRAAVLLREAGARPELALALRDAADLCERRGRPDEAAALRAEADRLAPGAALDAARLAAAIVDLGRLGALAPRREGMWGDVAARLCRDLGAERCALLQVRQGRPEVLAFRGSAAWRDAILAQPSPAEVTFAPALASAPASPAGQLVLVPFADDDLGRRGLVALENRDTRPLVGPADRALLAALGRQVCVLLANVDIWAELSEARRRLEQENRYHREAAPQAALGSGRIVGGSRALRQVLELVARVAPTTTPVLVTGETGTGKELVAREVHLLSPRRSGPFIAVHVAALASGLVASALFGHERGAFTGATEQQKGRFELADGGTLFLDEVGELSPGDQVRLLRVLQEGTFERVGGTRPLRSDFRLVAATHRDLQAAVRAGHFREDLYFRLAAFPIHVPALRERPQEIPTLALYFLEQTSRRLGVRFDGITEDDMARLAAYAWPGNVRELGHVVERAALLSDPPRLRVPPLEGGAPRAASPPVEDGPWVTLEEADRRYIRAVLGHARGRINGAGGAAEILGVKPSTLQFWIDKLGLREDLRAARGK